MQADDFFARVDELRTRHHLEPRIRRSLAGVIDALEDYVDKIYRLDEAAADHWRPESGPSSTGKVQAGEKGGVRMVREPKLDGFLRREVRRDLDGLVRHVGHLSQRTTEALYGRVSLRNRLDRGQVAQIRENASQGVTAAQLAVAHKVSEATIRDVVSGRTWREGS